MYTSLCPMLGFAFSIQPGTGVSEEKTEPRSLSLSDQQNDTDPKQPVQIAPQPAQIAPQPHCNQSLQETKKGSLVRPASFRRSTQLKPNDAPSKGDPFVCTDNSSLPTMTGMVLPQAGIPIQPENPLLPSVHDDGDESKSSTDKQPVTNASTESLPVVEDVSALPTMNGMVLPQAESMIQPENQYFSFKLNDDSDDDSDDDSESQQNADQQPMANPSPQPLPAMEDVSALPTMNGMVLPQAESMIQPENQYFSFKLDDDSDDDSEPSTPDQPAADPSPQPLPVMEGISVLPSLTQTHIPGMGGSVLPAVVPAPSPYPRPGLPLPTAPVMSASILPSTQTNSYPETPSMNRPAPPPPATESSAALQSTLTDLDIPYPHVADELDIPYPHIADQLKNSEAKPSEAPAINNGFSFPNPPMLNHTMQPNRGSAQPGTISVILPPLTTINENQVSTQDNLRIPSSSCGIGNQLLVVDYMTTRNGDTIASCVNSLNSLRSKLSQINVGFCFLVDG
ncbi:uncharacterized protein [Blastocystis hominis]|uniref:Uncharacterized protein n=1 Tax=Blastocystis hominis TaxID=12968 RepID=D8M6M3_BLAHO|nr:uncharacterized protein [Blastocystis hominis]CBK23441.2 unnamed protein product [Blastocystis hominis]|eukprot:XP_012897489.1 uncharacterized protein [Blastocystis hominis]